MREADALLPLTMLELRRQRPNVLRMAGLTLVILAAFYLAGKRSPSALFAALIGSSIGVVLIVPMGIARDKMEGTLEFLCGLPVEPRTIALSRLIALPILAAPWAAGVGLLSLALPSIAPLTGPGIALATWAGMLVLGAPATAMFAKFELENIFGVPTMALVLAVVLAPRIVRALFPALSAGDLRDWVQTPQAPALLALALACTLALVGTVSIALTISAIAGYRRDPAMH